MAIRLVVLGSGSAGNATCIEGGGSRVLLDAGFSCRELGSRLRAVGVEPERLDALVITHEHADHIRGAALFSQTYEIPVYCTTATFRAAGLERAGVHGHGVFAHIAVEPGRAFEVGGLRLRPFPVPHDAADTVGYAVECEGDRKSTRLNSSHSQISYAVFCLKKKNNASRSIANHRRMKIPQTALAHVDPCAKLPQTTRSNSAT